MAWFVLAVLGTVGGLIVVGGALVLLVRHRLHRRNRVDPTKPTAAPLHWLANPRTTAQLHRRLVRAARVADQAAEPWRPKGRKARRAAPPTLVAMADELRTQARALDEHLVRLLALPTATRIIALRSVYPAVADIEQAALQLSTLSADLATPRVLPDQQAGLADLGRRIEHLGQAHDKLRAIERDQGLVPATDVLPAIPVLDTTGYPSPQAAAGDR
ncbi:MAG TPA: hypothetical protein VGM93_04825 [Acidimicrobiales bacterium]